MTATAEDVEAALGDDGAQRVVGLWLSRRSTQRKIRLKPVGPARAPHYLEFVRRLDCCGCGAVGPSDPHHFGPRGVGQKTDDYRVVPLCRRCHDKAHHDLNDSRRRWLTAMQVEMLVDYLRTVERV